MCQTPAVACSSSRNQRAGISCWRDLRLHCSSLHPQPCARRHVQMESVWDQTSVYAPRDTKDVCVMKVEYDARNRCPSCVSNFFPITCLLLASLATRASICGLSSVSYWLQMWTNAVSRWGRVPSAAWTHTVAIAVTASLDTRSPQMDTPAAVSNFLLKRHIWGERFDFFFFNSERRKCVNWRRIRALLKRHLPPDYLYRGSNHPGMLFVAAQTFLG